MRQQCYGFQGYGHIKIEGPIYLRSKGKAMTVSLNDDDTTDQESNNEHEENFMAFTAIAEIDNIVVEDVANLQEAHNRLCKIAAKDAMSIVLSSKKIDTLKCEKKNLLVKLFDTTELLNAIKTNNSTLLDQVKELENELSFVREQLGTSSNSNLEDMLSVQKSFSNKKQLGYVKGDYSSNNTFIKFVNSSVEFIPKHEKKVLNEEKPMTRKIRVYLKESKPKLSTKSSSKK